MKRIVLLLDGTWNDADVGVSDTNIVRLRENIASCLAPSTARPDQTTPSSAPHQTSINFGTHDASGENISYIVFYERGVGTGGFLDNLRGGAFGVGLSRNIRRAYRFLARAYEPGDEIFIFGFSRGSYTARSLVGYLAAVGLLQAAYCNEVNESRAWSFYRTSPLDRLPSNDVAMRGLMHNPAEIRIKFLGVFDTVGAMGVPISWFKLENRDLFEFHDVGLSARCDVSVHALAIDEHREAFEATLWRKLKFGSHSAAVEQVWFAGAHSDVGGGYIDERVRDATSLLSLDDITLDWMIKKLLQVDNNFPVHQKYPNWPLNPESYLAPHHEARNSIFSARPFAFRSIGNCTGAARRSRWQIDVSYDRHNPAMNEAIHVSAMLRLGRPVLQGIRNTQYVPANLIKVLPLLERTLELEPTQRSSGLEIVGWSGARLADWEAKQLLADARDRLKILGIVTA